MRLVYFGSGAFGLPTLERLCAEHQIAAIVTQPDRPAGRNRALTPTPIAEFASRSGLAMIKPPRVNQAEIINRIQSLNAAAFVVIAFGQKLGRNLLADGGAFAINLHGSLLPKYRGAAPINWAIMNGETETGLSVITLADRMDAGDILAQRATPIDCMETAGELHGRLAAMGPEVITEVLRQFERGDLRPIAQDEGLVTHAPKLSKPDGTVRFDQAAKIVQRRVHGLTPWPGCTVKLAGRPLRLARVQVVESNQRHNDPGILLSDMSFACATGSIRLLEVQPPGGRLMSFDDYRRGQPVTIGSRCEPI